MSAPTLHRAPPREPFAALDWIAVVVAVCATLAVPMMTLVAQSFRTMYQDFGTTYAELPWLTRMVTMQLSPAAMTLPPVLALVLGLRAHGIGARRAGVVLSFVLALMALTLCWIGFYMPIGQVADAISTGVRGEPTPWRERHEGPRTSPLHGRTGSPRGPCRARRLRAAEPSGRDPILRLAPCGPRPHL